MLHRFTRSIWRTVWRKGLYFSLSVAMIGAIALGWNHLTFANPATAPSHPQLATAVASLPPVRFGVPVAIQGDGDDRKGTPTAAGSIAAYIPPEEVIPADPTNYGPRYLTDIYGNPETHPLLIVLHETVGSAASAINTFRTYHPRDEDQVSYHSLIRRDGTIVHLVHPQMRAFGAGNSIFNGLNGPETTRTNPEFPPSVNNFAYHTSLESPADGRGNQRGHSGYTQAQYQSLAWLVAHLPVPDERITTHQAVDRSGSRQDPRSFDRQRFLSLLHAYGREFENFTASP